MKEKFIRGICLSMCALLLSLSVAGSYSVPTYAATETETTLTKLIDMILTKTGIVASETILNDIKNDLFELLVSEGDVVIQYHIDNGLELTRDSLVDYWESQENSATGTRKFLISALLKSDLFIDTMYAIYAPYVENVEELVVREKDLLEGLGLFKILTSGVYKIWSEFVELIRALFDEYAESEADYFYIDTIGPNQLNPLWFPEKAFYDSFKSFLIQTKYVYSMGVASTDTYQVFTSGSDSSDKLSGFYSIYRYDDSFGIVNKEYDSAYWFYDYYVYSDSWGKVPISHLENIKWSTYSYTTDAEFEAILEANGGTCEGVTVGSNLNKNLLTGKYANLGIFTNDGRKMKVFKDLNTFKLYSVGQQPYYLNQNNDYSTTNDNSIDFSGNYYKDNSSNYSYDIVQNEIDNSTEVNEETINNIVNNTSQTIINNYYGSVDDGGGSGDGTGDVLQGGLTGFLEAVGSFLDFLLGLIGDVVNLLTTFLTSALALIGSLGSIFGDFGALLGDLFVFIPQECIDAITAGITLLVFVMIYKALK